MYLADTQKQTSVTQRGYLPVQNISNTNLLFEMFLSKEIIFYLRRNNKKPLSDQGKVILQRADELPGAD